MKCKSCGAPLSETSGRERMTCSFCGTIQLIDRERMTIDRIILLEESGRQECPSCAVPLRKALADNAPVEMCNECRGILFEREVFMQVVWQRRGAYRGSDETPLPINREELAERRPCPSCHHAMDCHPYYGPGNAVIDTCGRCDIVWLDAGELITLERAPGQRCLSTH